MRLVLLGAVLLVSTVVLAGCSAEDGTQHYVRTRVDAHVASLGGYPAERSHCTRTPRPWFVERETDVYICAVRRDDGDCDWFTATLTELDLRITLTDERAGCILPV